MSIWSTISKSISKISKKGEQLSKIFQKLKTPPEKTVGFTIAVIILSVKMAKADGIVKNEEIMAFRRVFFIPKNEEKYAALLFNLARQDVAGFEIYANKVNKMLYSNTKVLEELLEGLLHIATSDGIYHPLENQFIETVAKIFKINQNKLNILKSRYLPNEIINPFMVLGANQNWDFSVIKKKWKELVR